MAEHALVVAVEGRAVAALRELSGGAGTMAIDRTPVRVFDVRTRMTVSTCDIGPAERLRLRLPRSCDTLPKAAPRDEGIAAHRGSVA